MFSKQKIHQMNEAMIKVIHLGKIVVNFEKWLPYVRKISGKNIFINVSTHAYTYVYTELIIYIHIVIFILQYPRKTKKTYDCKRKNTRFSLLFLNINRKQ